MFGEKNYNEIRSFFAKNGYLFIFFACQKIINSFASKLASNFYTFDVCIIKYLKANNLIKSRK